jgi:hypothetical protein
LALSTVRPERTGRKPPVPWVRRGAWLVVAMLVFSGCGPTAPTVAETIDAFMAAVQNHDLDGLYCLMAGASEAEELGSDPADRRSGFDVWSLALYDSYLEGRDDGRVELDPQGLVLVKLFALGKGTYYVHTDIRKEGPDVRVVESDVRFGYSNIDLSGFSPGTTFYVSGTPIGRVHPIRVPRGASEISVELLTQVKLEWTLIRTQPAGGCDGGWAVASVVPVEGSARSAEVTWVF